MQHLYLSLAILLFAVSGHSRYFHLELGAGNYGQEGHTRLALFTTYGANDVNIKNTTSFFDDIPQNAAMAPMPLKSDIQYRVLFKTLDELVARNPGEQIVMHLNDLVPEWAEYACEKTREYAAMKGYDVIVEAIPGNYFKLNSTQSLSAYGEDKYDSVHLKNPELMYSEAVDGDNFLVTDASRQRMREGLQKVANLSKRGLHFFIINSYGYFPALERLQYSMRDKFYHNTSEWKGFGYDLPDGLWHCPAQATHVFFIARNN